MTLRPVATGQACGYRDTDHTGGLGAGAVSEWPACAGGAPLRSFHNASGYPLINLTRFPDMRAMTDFAHRLGLLRREPSVILPPHSR
jgi:hypothetical protein